MKTQTAADAMLRAYIECALWSTNDESDESGGEPLEVNYNRDDIDPETLAKMRADVESFYAANARHIAKWSGSTSPEVQAGHDLWLTRNGHGCGFWESEWVDIPGNPGKRLDAAANAMGEVWLYVGDDGRIHC